MVWGRGAGAGGFGASVTGAEPGASNYVRITRTKKVVTVAYSVDGEKWSEPVTVGLPGGFNFPDEVSVGVFFEHNTHQEGAGATFERLTVTKPK
jgi:hypothetical protein